MLEYWIVFPVAVLISTVAMVAGIGGAVLFSPFFLLIFPMIGLDALSAITAFGAALMIEVFGFSSGLYGYMRQKVIDYRAGLLMASIAIPIAVIAVFLSSAFSTDLLTVLFGVFMAVLAILFLKPENLRTWNARIKDREFHHDKVRLRISSDGQHYSYSFHGSRMGYALIAIGAFFTGLISVGIGETTTTNLVKRCKIPLRVAVGTSVLVVILTVLAASLTHLFLILIRGELLSFPWEILVFAIPGVLIGGQIGAKLNQKVSAHHIKRFIGLLFAMLAVILFFSAIKTFF